MLEGQPPAYQMVSMETTTKNLAGIGWDAGAKSGFYPLALP